MDGPRARGVVTTGPQKGDRELGTDCMIQKCTHGDLGFPYGFRLGCVGFGLLAAGRVRLLLEKGGIKRKLTGWPRRSAGWSDLRYLGPVGRQQRERGVGSAGSAEEQGKPGEGSSH